MTWRRLPTYFPNIRLQMLPLSPEDYSTLLSKGWLREVAFKCEPRTTKPEIKAFLEAVHGMHVEKVSTINYQGKKKRRVDDRGLPHYFRRSDWKKAYVLFKPPPGSDIEREYLQQRAEQQQQQLRKLEELKTAALARKQLPDLPPAAAAAVARAVAPTVLENARAAIRRAAERKAQGRRAGKQGSAQEQQQQQAEPQGAASRPRSRSSSRPAGKRS